MMQRPIFLFSRKSANCETAIRDRTFFFCFQAWDSVAYGQYHTLSNQWRSRQFLFTAYTVCTMKSAAFDFLRVCLRGLPIPTWYHSSKLKSKLWGTICCLLSKYIGHLSFRHKLVSFDIITLSFTLFILLTQVTSPQSLTDKTA